MLGYLCGYFRHYYPMEFATAYLNNAQNDEDVSTGMDVMRLYGIQQSNPKWGVSRGDFFFDKQNKVIYKGLSSVKYIGSSISDVLYNLSKEKHYTSFMDLLFDITAKTAVDSRQIDILIKIDFFSQFGNQRELFKMVDLFNLFKKGEAKQIKKELVDGTALEGSVKKYSVGTTKSGGVAKSYTLLDVRAILLDLERVVKEAHMDDLSDLVKVRNFYDAMGYIGYTSNKESDRRKLYVTDIYPLVRRADGIQFGYSVCTKSIGSGVEARFTVVNRVYDSDPINKGDIIYCKRFSRQGEYFRLEAYEQVI